MLRNIPTCMINNNERRRNTLGKILSQESARCLLGRLGRINLRVPSKEPAAVQLQTAIIIHLLYPLAVGVSRLLDWRDRKAENAPRLHQYVNAYNEQSLHSLSLSPLPPDSVTSRVNEPRREMVVVGYNVNRREFR